jgi:hypothetical protein
MRIDPMTCVYHVGINAFQTQNWTRSLGIPEKAEGSWRPWTFDGCQYIGGYVTEYEYDFTFLTVKGSGHMVRILCHYMTSHII